LITSHQHPSQSTREAQKQQYLVVSLVLLVLHGLAEAHYETVHIGMCRSCQLQRMLHCLQTQQQPPLPHVQLHCAQATQDSVPLNGLLRGR